MDLNLQNLNPDSNVNAADANLKNKQAFYELMIRDGYYLPKLNSKFMNQKMMQAIRDKKVFALLQKQVVFRICVSPPSKEHLLIKLHQYLGTLNLNSGIDLKKENFPDKDWVILAIATLSAGNDEIFTKAYFPPQGLRRKNLADGFSFANADGLLSNIPPHLIAKGGERSNRLSLLSQEDRQSLKLQKADQQVKRMVQAKEKLEKQFQL
jgi:hypothetical protein